MWDCCCTDLLSGPRSIEARLEEWRKSAAPLLDLRTPDVSKEWRLKGNVASIPWSQLGAEGFLLPPREKSFAILVPEGTFEEENTSFQTLALSPATPSPRALLSTFMSSRNPWNVTHVFVDTVSFRQAAEAAELRGDETSGVYQMWQPNPPLRMTIDKIEEMVRTRGRGSSPCSSASLLGGVSSEARLGSCLDLGCGAGRDSVFLALRGWDVMAVDNMKKALDRTSLLAAKCERTVRTLCVDAKKHPGSLVAALACCDVVDGSSSSSSMAGVAASAEQGGAASETAREGQQEREVSPLGTFGSGCDLVVVSRYFDRSLLASGLLRDTLVAPGGVIFFHHFLDGVQHHSIGHPSALKDYLLHDELFESFPGWEVLINDEATPLPDGRPMATFVAQRPLNTDHGSAGGCLKKQKAEDPKSNAE
jgi:SAM-dependent methyltransferase